MNEIIYPVRITKEIKEGIIKIQLDEISKTGYKVSRGDIIRKILIDYIRKNNKEEK